MLTFSSLHYLEHNHRDDHTSCKHGLYHKYAVRHNDHSYFLPTSCDNDLHFDHLAGSANNNLSCWHHYYHYGWGYSHTGRRH